MTSSTDLLIGIESQIWAHHISFPCNNLGTQDNLMALLNNLLSIILIPPIFGEPINPFATGKSEGSLFLENVGRIHLPAEGQRHLPQTLCHIIAMWKLYKSGIMRVNQMHKLQEFFQTDHFFSEFSRYSFFCRI